MNPLVSIIVPVYNGERVVERCLCSLRNQTYANLEFIIINDGSTDHTKKILDKYEVLDSRFRMIHKSNEGVSVARNLGLGIANGTYVQFVDCDDWVAKDATESLVAAISKNCQLCVCDYNRVVGKNIMVRGHTDSAGVISNEAFALQMMRAPANYYYGVLWNKLYVTEIIRKHGITFPTQRSWCEDFQFNLEYLNYVRQVYVLPKELYYYVRMKGSLSTSPVKISEVVEMKASLFEYYKALYETLGLYEDNKLAINRFFIDFARDRVKSVKVIRGVNVRNRKRRSKKLRRSQSDHRHSKLQRKKSHDYVMRYFWDSKI